MNYFKKARLLAEVKVAKVAQVMGVTRQTIYNWETEKANPNLEQLVVLSELYGVTTDALLKGDF